jgi:hypothetical protein
VIEGLAPALGGSIFYSLIIGGGDGCGLRADRGPLGAQGPLLASQVPCSGRLGRRGPHKLCGV